MIYPSKTALYGWIGAVIGLEKFDNLYLKSFPEGDCKIGLQICRPIVKQRININLHPHDKGLITAKQNRKPTTLEFVYQPSYRIFFTHQNEDIFNRLKTHLQNHTAVYTPTLGLANLFCNFKFLSEKDATLIKNVERQALNINSVIPRTQFLDFDFDYNQGNDIMEYSQFAVEMNINREVINRDDVFFDRNGKKIKAIVKTYYSFQLNNETQYVTLF